MDRVIYISVNGIGLGHARRSIRLGEALSKFGKIVFSTYNETSALNYLARSEFRVIGLPSLSWMQSPDGGLDNAKTLLFSPYGAGIAFSHLLIERYLIRVLNPTIIISDMRASPIMIADKYNIPCFMLGLFFDLKREIDSFFIRQPARLLGGFIRDLARRCIKTFITDFPPPYTLYERVMPEKIPKNFVFTGPIIDKKLEAIVRRVELVTAKEEAKKRLSITEEKVVLFLPSGVKKSRAFFINGVLSIINRLKREKNVRFIISLGLLEERLRVFKMGNIEVWNWIPNLTDYLLSADLVVGYYGMNKVFDSIAAGCLFLGKVANNQVEQLALARKVREFGLGDVFNLFNEEFLEKMLYLVESKDNFSVMSKFHRLIRKMNPINVIIRNVTPYLD